MSSTLPNSNPRVRPFRESTAIHERLHPEEEATSLLARLRDDPRIGLVLFYLTFTFSLAQVRRGEGGGGKGRNIKSGSLFTLLIYLLIHPSNNNPFGSGSLVSPSSVIIGIHRVIGPFAFT